jgi:hypothetical protein
MPAATSLAIAGLVVSAVGTGAAVYSQQKAASAQKDQGKEQEKQAAIQKRLEEIQNQRAARDLERKRRVAQGALNNAAANTGTQGSTGALGAGAAIVGQSDMNAGYLSATGAAQGDIADSARRSLGLSQDIASANRNAQVSGAVAGVANQVFDASGGYKTLFAGDTSKTNSSIFASD